MGRKWLVVLCMVLALMPVIMTGCSRDDVAIVRIQLQNMPKGAPHTTSSLLERVFRWFVTDAIAGWDYPNTALQVVVTAPDLNAVTFSVPYEQQSTVTIEVPSGSKRRITVYGYYDYTEAIDKTWGGHAEVDLNPGEEKDVQINMLPFMIIYASCGLTTIDVGWNPLYSPAFGILGYNLYRSDSADGPYVKIGSVSDVLTGSFEDTTGVIEGNTYYYKVSVYTDTSEGELSDYYEILFTPIG